MVLRYFLDRFRPWILSSGGGRTFDSEAKDRFFHYSVFLLLGIPTMLAFGWYHIALHNYLLSLFVFISGIGLVAGWLSLWYSGRGLNVYRCNVGLFAILLLYMLGVGTEGSGTILWMYTYPLIVLFLLGQREGLAWNSGLLVSGVALIFFGQHITEVSTYSAGFVLRFVVSYLIVSAIAFWFEFLRSKYRRGMEDKSNLLELEMQHLQENVYQRILAEKEKDELILVLNKTLEEVQVLRGFLPICSYCHKIRDDAGFWNQLEAYIQAHTDVKFSHGICPDCKQEHFPSFGRK